MRLSSMREKTTSDKDLHFRWRALSILCTRDRSEYKEIHRQRFCTFLCALRDGPYERIRIGTDSRL